MATPSRNEKLLEIEVYTQSPVQTGRVSCPATTRVLDLLNNHLFLDAGGEDSFLEMIETGGAGGQEGTHIYIRKSAIQIIAVTEDNTGRSVGAASNRNSYPFVCKVSSRVTIEMRNYAVVGNMHCSGDQCVIALLNERKAFMPLTEVVITNSSGLRQERPFVAINKYQVISLR